MDNLGITTYKRVWAAAGKKGGSFLTEAAIKGAQERMPGYTSSVITRNGCSPMWIKGLYRGSRTVVILHNGVKFVEYRQGHCEVADDVNKTEGETRFSNPNVSFRISMSRVLQRPSPLGRMLSLSISRHHLLEDMNIQQPRWNCFHLLGMWRIEEA